jgi:hypothetical protein
MTRSRPRAAGRSVGRQRVVRVVEPLRTHARLGSSEPGASVRRQAAVAIGHGSRSITRLTQTVSVPNPATYSTTVAYTPNPHSAADSGARTHTSAWTTTSARPTASTRTTASASSQNQCRRKQQRHY